MARPTSSHGSTTRDARGWRRLAVLCLVIAVGGCSRKLPTEPNAPAPGGAIGACAGVGLDAFLHGDPADPRTAWVEGSSGRVDVLFPAGYTARFAPRLEVLDPAGRVVMAEGDFVYGACVGPNDALTVDPGATLRLDCGPVPLPACTANAPSIASQQPGRNNSEVASLRFTGADGAYVVTFEDGSTAEGRADLGQ